MSRALPPHWPQSAELAHKISQYTAVVPRKAPSPRLGRKGFLYLQKQAQHHTKPEERVRITARRILKAERDERMDITRALTPVKQYMAGFTRPSDLRGSNWFPGGTYVARGKVYESPAEEAYEPHTVFLLESRYNIRFGVGRVDAPHYIYGICREQDLPDILKVYNSPKAPRDVLEAMDNARWPWGPQTSAHKPVKWWVDNAELRETLQELGSVDLPKSAKALAEQEYDDDDEVESVNPVKTGKKRRRVTDLNPTRSHPTTIPPPGDFPSSIPGSARAFHSSSILFVGHSYNDDHIVPDFYVQHKQAKAEKEKDDPESKTDERPQLQDTPSLMDHLSDGILSDEIVASTRRIPSKIPTELVDADGVFVHPSGFVVPTPSQYTSPERTQRDGGLAQQTAAVAERVLEEDFTDVTAETSSRRGKVPFEVRCEDGTVSHPSGFVPPTAADDFEHSGNSTVDSHIGQQPLVLGSTPPGSKRGLHTTASARAEELEKWDFVRAKAQLPKDTFIPRHQYIPTLDEKPFWRPLITLTVSTRPIGLSLLRLSKGQPTGRPFHADISLDDRKCRISYANRMRSVRVKRMQNLAVEMAQILAGSRGGAVGIRFETDTLGRGIGGEGLENSIPWEKRVIGVGVADWYRMAPEVKTLFRARGSEEVPACSDRESAFEVCRLNDFGYRISEETNQVVPWRTRQETQVDKWQNEPWHAEYLILRRACELYKRWNYAQTAASLEQKAAEESRKAYGFKSATPVKTTPVNEETDEEDIELAEDDEHMIDDNTGDTVSSDPKSIAPIVMVRESENVISRLLGQMADEADDDMPFEELERPPDFLLLRPDGTPWLGPLDSQTGEINTKAMTYTLPINVGRRLLQRRLNMFYIKKNKEIGAMMASKSIKVDYPWRIVS
ncbi:hypothetical protein C8R44DRAFT_175979 [Mycena epipterygia]|nr:hypothetical protein C8R44DRAFT_175979 [Mycena epipterygia]